MNPLNWIKGFFTALASILVVVFGAYNWGKKSKKNEDNEKVIEFVEGNLEISDDIKRRSESELDDMLRKEDEVRKRVRARKNSVR